MDRFTNQLGYSPVVLDELHVDELYVSDPGAEVVGENTEIQYNDNGAYASDSSLLYKAGVLRATILDTENLRNPSGGIYLSAGNTSVVPLAAPTNSLVISGGSNTFGDTMGGPSASFTCGTTRGIFNIKGGSLVSSGNINAGASVSLSGLNDRVMTLAGGDAGALGPGGPVEITVTNAVVLTANDLVDNDGIAGDNLVIKSGSGGSAPGVDGSVTLKGATVTFKQRGRSYLWPVPASTPSLGSALFVTTAGLQMDFLQLSGGATLSSAGVLTLAANSATNAAIKDANVTAGKLGANSITAAKLANTSVVAGSYTNTTITVDQQGRLTAAASTSQTKPYLSVYRTTDIGPSNLINTDLSFDSTPISSGSGITYSAPVFTLQANKLYLLQVFITCLGDATVNASSTWRWVNSATNAGLPGHYASVAPTNYVENTSFNGYHAIVYSTFSSAITTIKFRCFVSSGGTIHALRGGSRFTFASVTEISG